MERSLSFLSAGNYGSISCRMLAMQATTTTTHYSPMITYHASFCSLDSLCKLSSLISLAVQEGVNVAVMEIAVAMR